ncbi:unnamed protein product [Urochloa decumbens]|uniref:KIB1-4 beta-propeller domain-containing protein n=1 Tax=Urochloa decumbens TaxID=240449 RepID=A0ABC9BKX4_9POAL
MANSSTRPRRRRRVAADAARDDASPWASLHEDLISLIAWRVLAGDLCDYVRFRAACQHWRSSTACPRGRGIADRRFHPRRWMLFPEGQGLHPGHGKLRGHVRFFNLSTGGFVRVQLPIFRDHCVLDSVDGILLLQRDHDTAVRLLHPFTGDIAEFPPLETLDAHLSGWLLRGKRMYLRQICGTCISVDADGVVKVMMALFGMPNLCFATSGDQQWRVSSWWHDMRSVPLPFQGKLYTLQHPEAGDEPEALQVDPPRQEDTDSGSRWLPPPKTIAKCPASNCNSFSYYLVECSSEILVIALRHGKYRQYSVYRLADLIQGRTVRLTRIDGNTIFLGSQRSLCVSSEVFPSIMADTIVAFDS